MKNNPQSQKIENPAGTAVIEMEIDLEQLKSVTGGIESEALPFASSSSRTTLD